MPCFKTRVAIISDTAVQHMHVVVNKEARHVRPIASS